MSLNEARRTTLRFGLAVLVVSAVFTPPEIYPASEAPMPRIDFLVTTVETSGGDTVVLSQARVDGPPGTDFTVELDYGRFEMHARFRTERAGDDALQVHSLLETRRFYGMSERDLPLYEEDVQRSVIDLRFDDTLLLLPFGGEDETDNLKIEIVPGLSETSPRLPDGDLRPLEIELLKPAPGGVVTVRAEKIPHWFEIEASVVSGGREVASGSGRVFIEERGRIVIEPRDGPSRASAPGRLFLDLSVDRFERSRPSGHVTVSFDIVAGAVGPVGTARPIAANWAGALGVGSSLTYDLPAGLFEPDSTAQITIGVHESDTNGGNP